MNQSEIFEALDELNKEIADIFSFSEESMNVTIAKRVTISLSPITFLSKQSLKNLLKRELGYYRMYEYLEHV